jgi:hypothetical protein
MNKAIGGYFELELRKGEHYHKEAIRLNTARNCLEYILKVRKYSKVYIPYYTCEVILEPLKKCNVNYEFYSINNQFEPVKKYKLSEKEAFLYTNYFGIKSDAVTKMATIYGDKLIIDNSQAFYAKPIEGIDTFYSARKFFGVSDGAYLYTDKYLEDELEQDLSYSRMSHLLKRIDLGAESGYNDFKANDDSLIGQPIKKMSLLTEKILETVDYQQIKDIRRKNYIYFDDLLQKRNLLNLKLEDKDIPMVYPFLSRQKDLKKTLIENKIFVATYWSNVFEWCAVNSMEYQIVQKMVSLPIDQRYKEEEIKYVVSIIQN